MSSDLRTHGSKSVVVHFVLIQLLGTDEMGGRSEDRSSRHPKPLRRVRVPGEGGIPRTSRTPLRSGGKYTLSDLSDFRSLAAFLWRLSNGGQHRPEITRSVIADVVGEEGGRAVDPAADAAQKSSRTRGA